MTPTLDLHGKTQDEAQEYLSKQLSLFKMQGEQWVTVITGRGHSKKGADMGTLKLKVPGWLRGVKYKAIVKSVTQIPQNPGALLVELKQKPKPKLRLVKDK